MLAILTSHPIQYQAPLWRALAQAGIDFEVWFLTPHGVEASYDREFSRTFAWDLDLLAGYPHRFMPISPGWKMNRFHGVRLTTRWADELRRRGVTRLWVEGWRFLEIWRAVGAAHAMGIEVWLRGETHALAPQPALRRLAKRPFMAWFFARVDRYLYIGAANRAYYERQGIADAKLHPAPYCVDNARFIAEAQRLRPTQAQLRADWGIPPAAFLIMFCGKLIAKKRPLDVVAAARRISALGGRSPHLLFVGDGELAPEVRAAFQALPAVTAVITGFLNQTQLPAAYAAADLLVLPSDYGETWGLVVNEALASGIPAIASDRCGCARDLCAPLGSAHVFPCGDIAAFATSIERVAAAPPPAAAMRALIERYAPERTAQTVKRLIESGGGETRAV